MTTEVDGEHFYECTGCGGVFDDRDGEPEVIPPRHSSPDGLPDVLCPRCRDAAFPATPGDVEAS